MSKLVVSMNYAKQRQLELDYIEIYGQGEDRYFTINQLLSENPFPQIPIIEIYDKEKSCMYRIEASDNLDSYSAYVKKLGLNELLDITNSIGKDDYVYNLFRTIFLAVKDRYINLYETDKCFIEYLDKLPGGKRVKRKHTINYRTMWLDTKNSNIERFKRSFGIRGELKHSFPRIGHYRTIQGIGKNHLGERVLNGKTWIEATWVREDLERNEKYVVKIK